MLVIDDDVPPGVRVMAADGITTIAQNSRRNPNTVMFRLPGCSVITILIDSIIRQENLI
jgi:hypothetical protein